MAKFNVKTYNTLQKKTIKKALCVFSHSLDQERNK